MIIDINDRQTGKTTRMIEHAVRLLKTTRKEIVIVGYNVESASYIKKKLLQSFPDMYSQRKRILTSSKMIRQKINLVDEFDHNRHEMFLCDDCYYNGTLKKTLSSFAFELQRYQKKLKQDLDFLNVAKNFFYRN